MVPPSFFWLYDDAIPVGYGQIRHYLNDNLKETGGHIGDAIGIAKGQMQGTGYRSITNWGECKQRAVKQGHYSYWRRPVSRAQGKELLSY